MTSSPRRYRAEHALLGVNLELAEDVLIEIAADGHISEIRSGRGTSGAVLLDGVLAPGLVDCHVHLTLNGGTKVEQDARSLDVESALALAEASARAHLRYGVTTVRDLGSTADAAYRVASRRDPELPRIVAAGAVTNPDGQGSLFARTARGPREVVERVDEIAKTGMRWLKLYLTGGMAALDVDRDHRQLDDDETEAAVGAARRHGLSVAVHAHGPNGIRAALDARVQSVEHLARADAANLDAFRMGHSTAVVTLVSTARLVDSLDAADPGRSLPAAHLSRERRTAEALRLAGISFALGTDAGTTANPHGDGLLAEAVLLQGDGMDAHDILRALTVEGAALTDRDAGSIEVGRRADWILAHSDPTVDISMLSDLRGVFRAGLAVKR